MAATLTTTAECIAKAGENADATIVADTTQITAWIEQAEGYIEHSTRRSWVANFSSLGTPAKAILDDFCSSFVARRIIAYNTTGYLSREADTLMNENTDSMRNAERALKDPKSNDLVTP